MNVLSIGGSDPSSGAGIQGDIKTFSSNGVYGHTVVTTITSQNTTKFSKIEKVSSSMIKNQIDSVVSDFDLHAIKIEVDKRRLRPVKSEVGRLICDASKLRSACGWKAQKSLKDGLKTTCQWVKANLKQYKTDIYNV